MSENDNDNEKGITPENGNENEAQTPNTNAEMNATPAELDDMLQVRRDIPLNINDIMHTAYLQYSLSVNVGRAVPDVRDGLKPGNRRILFAMSKLGLTKGGGYTKSAKVVGEVIGNYHPHGDAAVYDTMVRMAQDFAMRKPLVDGQGNFGSIDGDSAAAYRYTECRMERVTEELLADINKDTVNMIPTFDEKNLEPEVLPSKFPNLLVNGTTGIGVGMATNIPTHNLGEIIDATVLLLDNPEATITEMMEVLPGPDFPTGGIICGRNETHRFYSTGKGSITMRAKAKIVENPRNGQEQIIVTEIPYAVNKQNLVEKIADLVKEKRITGISGLRDESSSRVGIRIVVDIKRGEMGSVVLNQLYTHTMLQTTFPACMLVVHQNRPSIMNLREVLQAYIDHRIEVVTRRTQFELNKALERAHIVEGLLIAVKNIDEVVKIIRESRTTELAAQNLIERFNLSKRQVKAILEMRLSQLTGLAIEDLESEFKQLEEAIANYRAILASRQKILDIIKTELIEVKTKYADPRRTEIIAAADDLSIADLITPHSCVITVSKTGYIKRQPADTFRKQNRGGKGIIGMETKEQDSVEHLFNANSHDLIFFITQKGVMHWMNVYDIPECSRISRGQAIVNLIKIEPGESIRTMFTTQRENMERNDLFLFMATRNGVVKKTELSQFRHLRRAGIRAISIDDGDDLVGAQLTEGRSHIVISTALGMANHFVETDVRSMGRTARGVRGIRFRKDSDYVVSMQVFPEIPAEVDPEDNGPEILVITSGGMGKRSYVKDYRLTRRGSMGVTSIRFKQPNESVIETLQIQTGDEIIITTIKGIIVRLSCDQIRTIGRASMGVRLMTFKNRNDKVASVAKIISVDGEKLEDDENVEMAELPEQDPADLEEIVEEEIIEDDVINDDEIEDDANVNESTDE